MKRKFLSILLSLAMVTSAVPMMTLTANADTKDLSKDQKIEIGENLLAAATLDTQAKKLAASEIIAACMSAMALATRPEVSTDPIGEIKKASNLLVDAIGLARTEERVDAIKKFGVSALSSMGAIAQPPRISTTEKDYNLQVIAQAVKNVTASLLIQVSDKKAAALSTIAVEECKGLQSKPSTEEFLKAYTLLDASITVGADTSLTELTAIGKAVMSAIAANPAYANAIINELTAKLALYEVLDLQKYTVRFDTNGGSDVKSVKVAVEEKVSKPSEPTRDGYLFAGWYADPELNTEWDFDTKITKDITLYAKWEEDPNVEWRIVERLNETAATIKATFNADGKVVLSWNLNENATGYEISAQLSEHTVNIDIDSKDTTSLVTSLIAPTYSIRAYTINDGKTYYGSESELSKIKLSKAKITSLKSSAKGKAVVKYAKVTGAKTYEVRYKLAGSKWKTVNTTKLNRTIKKLSSGKKLTVKVRGKYSAGAINIAGAWSATKTVKVR